MTLTDIADAVWTYATRTLDGLVPPGPTPGLDAIAYEVWIYNPRTVSNPPVAGGFINWLPYVFHGRGGMGL